MTMDPTNDVVEVFHAKDGWRWHRRDKHTNDIVAESGEGYVNHGDALEAAGELNQGVPILDLDANHEAHASD